MTDGHDQRAHSQVEQLCRRLGVEPKVHLGLDPRGPSIQGAGDATYALGPELGRGGGGRVLLGVDRDLRRSVAIKLLPRQRAGDPKAVQAFIEEAIITGGLEHPNIVPAYELGHSERFGLYYTMKRLTGRPLWQILEALRGGRKDLERHFGLFRMLGCFVDMCRAIAYAHGRGVLHSDLKPGNILIGTYGETVVVDWGLAQITGPAGGEQARAGMRAGTPEYVSPEVASGPAGVLDERSDIWALGVILYEMLTLSVPFKGDTTEETLTKVVTEPLTPPSRFAPDRSIPPGIEQICMRALEKKPSRRYQSVNHLLEDVEAYLEGTRERMRRIEQARYALSIARATIEEVGEDEDAVDALLSRARQDADGPAVVDRLAPADIEALQSTRQKLLAAYERAATSLGRGFESGAEINLLNDAVGDLYWRAFARVYPSQLQPSASLANRATALLGKLSERSIAAVVKMGRQLADQLADPSSSSELDAVTQDDPWLATVVAFCRRKDHLDGDQTPSAMSALAQRIVFLKRVALFGAMPACDLLPVAEACSEEAYDAEQAIATQGERGDSLYVLLEGRVEVRRDDAVINHLASGDVFGEIAVLGESPRTASVITTEPTRCLILDAPAFRQIVRDNGDIGLAVIQFLIERLRFATEREAALRHTSSPALGG